jgi:hypothetical protein
MALVHPGVWRSIGWRYIGLWRNLTITPVVGEFKLIHVVMDMCSLILDARPAKSYPVGMPRTVQVEPCGVVCAEPK